MKLWDKEKGWRNLLFNNWRDYIIFLMAILLILSNKQAYSQVEHILEDPCAYCNCALKDTPFLEVNYSGGENSNSSVLFLGGSADSEEGPAGVPK